MSSWGSRGRWSGMVLAVAVLVAACGGSGDDDDSSAAADATGPPYDVGEQSLTLTDTSRMTQEDPDRGLVERPERELPVMVLHPQAAGTFPLVVFAHGHSREGTEYEGLLREWAEQGYVVAAPTFPLTSGDTATTPVSYADVTNQPGDISFVIQELIAQRDDIDADAVGVVGHSLGAITVLGLRNNTCCLDPAVKAAVAVSGVELPFPGQPVTAADAPPPLLLVHGGGDPTVPVSGSEAAFANDVAPVAFLRFDEGGHDEVLDGGGAQADMSETAVLAFFDHILRHDDEAWDRLADEVEESHLGTFQQR